jgi:hypothetical protein
MFCVFVGCLPGITQPGFFHLAGLWRSINAAGGGGPQLAIPPGPRLAIAKFWQGFLHCLQLSTMSYNVLHCYPRLALAIRL